MASAALVKQDLTPEMIRAGAYLVRALDTANIPVTAAFWLYYGDDPDWRLRIVSPEVAQLGTHARSLPQARSPNARIATAGAHIQQRNRHRSR